MVSPIVAAIISFFFPGIGQVVQGETKKGIIMFVAAIVISIILTYALGTIGNIIYLIYAVYAAYDAYNMGLINFYPLFFYKTFFLKHKFC